MRSPSPGIIEPLLAEYHASGNPGRFAVITTATMLMSFPPARSASGRSVESQPILSTVVRVNLGVGLCNDVLSGLPVTLGRLCTIRP